MTTRGSEKALGKAGSEKASLQLERLQQIEIMGGYSRQKTENKEKVETEQCGLKSMSELKGKGSQRLRWR